MKNLCVSGSQPVQQCAFLIRLTRCSRFFLVLLIFHLSCLSIYAQVAPDDLAEAESLSRNYKDDNVICRSSYHFFTFDKGKNSLNDKVVVVQEDAEMEFLSLQKYASLTYPEFYNKFIQLKTFKKAVKLGRNYITSERSGKRRGKYCTRLSIIKQKILITYSAVTILVAGGIKEETETQGYGYPQRNTSDKTISVGLSGGLGCLVNFN